MSANGMSGNEVSSDRRAAPSAMVGPGPRPTPRSVTWRRGGIAEPSAEVSAPRQRMVTSRTGTPTWDADLTGLVRYQTLKPKVLGPRVPPRARGRGVNCNHPITLFGFRLSTRSNHRNTRIAPRPGRPQLPVRLGARGGSSVN
jgi:hypothetical protein